MPKVSVIIPARKERYLGETLADLYEKRGGSIEVFVILDGWEPEFEIPEYPGLMILKNSAVEGMRYCINEAAKLARGKYLMKLDAHCMLGENWDKILQAECEDNWIVAPRRYKLNPVTWEREGKPVDFQGYIYPHIHTYRPYLTCRPYYERAEQLADQDIHEDMGFQGSLWFMTRQHFEKRLGGMSTYGYGSFSSEPEEIGLKTWLGPWNGRVIRNKKTWYAHWSKPSIHWRTPAEQAGRCPDDEREAGWFYCFDYWFHNRWPERAHDFEWLIDRFWPLRTWPDNWKELVKQYNRYPTATLHTIDGLPFNNKAREVKRAREAVKS